MRWSILCPDWMKKHLKILYGFDDTFWLTQKAMAELFGCSSDNISLHLKNIYNEEELSEEATAEEFSVVQREGKRDVSRNVKCYNLDAIIAVEKAEKEYNRFRVKIFYMR